MQVRGFTVFTSRKTVTGVHAGYVKEVDGKGAFVHPSVIVRDFLRDAWTTFRGNTTMYVSGSYIPWCLDGRPEAWTPGDIDVYVDHEAYLLSQNMKTWAENYGGRGFDLRIKTDLPTRTSKFDVEFLSFAPTVHTEPLGKVSFIFRRAIDAVPLFDLSILRTYVPITALYMRDNSLYYFDEGDLRDLHMMRARTHPVFASRPAEVTPDMPQVVQDFLLGDEIHREREYGRMDKYRKRGWEIVGDSDPKRAELYLSALTWYSDMKELHPVRPPLECSQ